MYLHLEWWRKLYLKEYNMLFFLVLECYVLDWIKKALNFYYNKILFTHKHQLMSIFLKNPGQMEWNSSFLFSSSMNIFASSEKREKLMYFQDFCIFSGNLAWCPVPQSQVMKMTWAPYPPDSPIWTPVLEIRVKEANLWHPVVLHQPMDIQLLLAGKVTTVPHPIADRITKSSILSRSALAPK